MVGYATEPLSYAWITQTRKITSIYQGSYDHVKVGPMPVLALHNLGRQIHMFLDILEFKVESKNCFGNVISNLLKNGLNCT